MQRVSLESPFKTLCLHVGGKEIWLLEEDNLAYARAAARDCALREESSFGSHLYFTQKGILDDNNPAERDLGIRLGLVWKQVAEKTVIYIDRGITEGTWKYAIPYCQKHGHPIEYRRLGGDWAIDELANLSVEELVEVLQVSMEKNRQRG